MDFCCGHGRHFINLFEKGFDVYGLDINETFLDKIKEKVKADGRFFKGQGDFDFVINMETSIGYQIDSENNKMLESMYSCLKPNGKLLIHVANRDYFIRPPQKRTWFTNGKGQYVISKRKFNIITSTLRITEERLFSKDNIVTKKQNIRLYLAAELNALLRTFGFFIDDVYGGFSNEKYNADSTELIVLAHK